MSDTVFTGPVKAGNVLQSDGTGNLAGVGGSSGTANVGYAVMAQSEVVTQAAGGGGGTGVYISSIVIPAQSQIVSISLMVTAAWSGVSKTVGIGTTVTAAALTAAGALDGTALGPLAATPGTDATRIGNWDNVGSTDVQIKLTSTNTGTGVGTLTVQYIQAINLAS